MFRVVALCDDRVTSSTNSGSCFGRVPMMTVAIVVRAELPGCPCPRKEKIALDRGTGPLLAC
jgi:hypothetical protein